LINSTYLFKNKNKNKTFNSIIHDLNFDYRVGIRFYFTPQPTTIRGDGFRLLQHLPDFDAGLTAVGQDNLEILDNFWKECSKAHGKLDRLWLEKLKVIGV